MPSASHVAWFPTWHRIIPRRTVSHAARYPTRHSVHADGVRLLAIGWTAPAFVFDQDMSKKASSMKAAAGK